MPCNSDYMKPTDREMESARVDEFLKEVRGERFNHDRPSSAYGNIETLDADTATLCTWCRTHDVTTTSLELQLWWQRHQKKDAEREAQEREAAEEMRVKAAALAKLTPEEQRALGVAHLVKRVTRVPRS